MEKQSEACSGSHCLLPPQGMSPVWLTFCSCSLWSSQRLQESKQSGLAPDPTPSQRPCLANLMSCLC